MQIILNGQSLEIKSSINLQQLLVQLGFDKTCFAVAHNHQFIPKIQYVDVFLQENDLVEILTPMQGG